MRGGVAEFALQLLQRFLGEALPVAAAVEDLQRLDLGVVLLDVFAEAADEAFGLFLRRGVEALAGDLVHGDDVDDLIGLLPRIGDGVAQRGFVERLAGFERELGAGLLEEGGIDFVRAGAGNAGGLFGDDIGIEGAQQGGGEFGEGLAAGELGEFRAALGRRWRGRAGRGGWRGR